MVRFEAAQVPTVIPAELVGRLMGAQEQVVMRDSQLEVAEEVVEERL